MKKIALKATLWLLPIATLGLVASATLATSPPSNDHDKPKAGRSVKFTHDDAIDTYLTSIRSFMLMPPRDGFFGASRIPTLHGANRNKVPGYDKIASLIEKEYSFTSSVVGHTPEDRLAIYRTSVKNGQMQEKDLPLYRMATVHRGLSTPVAKQGANSFVGEFFKQTNTKSIDLAAICFKEGYDSYSDSFDIAGHPSWIMAKAVHASEKSCYSCHTDVKEGQPIGYVVAVLTKNTP